MGVWESGSMVIVRCLGVLEFSNLNFNERKKVLEKFWGTQSD